VAQRWSWTIRDLARVDGVATRHLGLTRSRLVGDIEVAFSLHVSLMWQSDLARSPAGLAEVAEV
jgi:hypothetical protein